MKTVDLTHSEESNTELLEKLQTCEFCCNLFCVCQSEAGHLPSDIKQNRSKMCLCLRNNGEHFILWYKKPEDLTET